MGWQGCTTVMLRNIPGRYSQQSLLAEVQAAGYQPDFFYLPMDFQRDANSGYCFLNLAPEAVTRFRRRFDGQRLAHRSGKLLQVVPAATQGYEANYDKFAHSAVLNHHKTEHQPLFLRGDPDTGRARPRARTAPPATPAGSGLYVLRELPKMYTEEMVMMELVHHGCADAVVALQVPTDQAGLNLGYALVRFSPTYAAQCKKALRGASFHLAPAALAMDLAEVHAHGQPQQVPMVVPLTPASRTPGDPGSAPLTPGLRADAPAFVPFAPSAYEEAKAPANQGFEPFSFEDDADSDPACEPAAPVTPEKPKSDPQGESTPTAWERYAELLTHVPQEEWSGELLLRHFGTDELKEMQETAIATLRDSRESLGRYGNLGIDMEDEAHDGADGTVKAELRLWRGAPGQLSGATPPYQMATGVACKSGLDMSPNAETPVLKPQTLIQAARLSATPPTRSNSSGSRTSRSTSPCETPCDTLARVPYTPFHLGRQVPAPATPTSEKRVRFAEPEKLVHTVPFHTDTPALFSCRDSRHTAGMLPPPPPDGP